MPQGPGAGYYGNVGGSIAVLAELILFSQRSTSQPEATAKYYCALRTIHYLPPFAIITATLTAPPQRVRKPVAFQNKTDRIFFGIDFDDCAPASAAVTKTEKEFEVSKSKDKG